MSDPREVKLPWQNFTDADAEVVVVDMKKLSLRTLTVDRKDQLIVWLYSEVMRLRALQKSDVQLAALREYYGDDE